MSCADVCLDHGWDGENSFFSERMRVARKPHRCCECGDTILAGEHYQRARGHTEGSFWTNATCAICAEIRSTFVCGTWIYGQLWASIREDMFPIWIERGPLDCLAKLDTLAARDMCRQRYEEWEQRWYPKSPAGDSL